MFIKTKKRFGGTYYYLAQSRREGKKMHQRCAYIGNRLNLTCAEWLGALRKANGSKHQGFSPLTIRDFFIAVQKYVEKHSLPPAMMAGLREAIKFVVNHGHHYTVLGLKAGSSAAEIQTAFRALSRIHHPDVGGDPYRFREIVAARDRLTAFSGLQSLGKR